MRAGKWWVAVILNRVLSAGLTGKVTFKECTVWNTGTSKRVSIWQFFKAVLKLKIEDKSVLD